MSELKRLNNNSIMMASQYTSSYCVNNHLLYEQIIDDMGQAAARSDQKISFRKRLLCMRAYINAKTDCLDLYYK